MKKKRTVKKKVELSLWNKVTNFGEVVMGHVKDHCWHCIESLGLGALGVALVLGCLGLPTVLGVLLVGHAVKRLLHK
jgi:hypothetical protein